MKTRNFIYFSVFNILAFWFFATIADFVLVKMRNDLVGRREAKQFFKKLEKQGMYMNFVPSAADSKINITRVWAKQLNFYPLSSYPDKEVWYCNEGHGYITFKPDHMGFRNSKEDWIGNDYSYVVGDSFGHGGCVEEKDSIVGNLQKNTKFHKYRNLSGSGNNPVHYDLILETFLNPNLYKSNSIAKPKNVILIFSENDFNKDEIKDTQSAKKFIKPKPGYLINENGEWRISDQGKTFFDYAYQKASFNKSTSNSNFFKKIINKFHRYKAAALSRIALSEIRRRISLILPTKFKMNNHSPESAKGSLKKTINFCSKIECNVIAVFISGSRYWSYSYPLEENSAYKSFIKYASELKESNLNINYSFVNSAEILIDAPDPQGDFAKEGGHLSPKGYFKLSEIINNKIIKFRDL